MARSFDHTASEYLSVSGMLGEPATISCAVWVRFNATVDTDGSSVISLGDNFGIILNDELSTGYIRGFWYDNQNWQDIDDTSQDWKDAGWVHIVLVVNPSGSSQVLYVNGAASDSDNRNNAIVWGNNGSDTFIGKHADGGTTWDMSGGIAELAVWDSALTAADAAALASGYAPPFIQPQNMVAYWPLIRDGDKDRLGDYDLTAYNTPTIEAHPPVIYPAMVHQGFTTAAAANAMPMAIHSYRQRRS